MVRSINSVSTESQQISTASREQRSGVSQVGEALANMDQVTQQSANWVEAMAVAAGRMRHRATELAQTEAVFKLLR